MKSKEMTGIDKIDIGLNKQKVHHKRKKDLLNSSRTTSITPI